MVIYQESLNVTPRDLETKCQENHNDYKTKEYRVGISLGYLRI